VEHWPTRREPPHDRPRSRHPAPSDTARWADRSCSSADRPRPGHRQQRHLTGVLRRLQSQPDFEPLPFALPCVPPVHARSSICSMKARAASGGRLRRGQDSLERYEESGNTGPRTPALRPRPRDTAWVAAGVRVEGSRSRVRAGLDPMRGDKVAASASGAPSSFPARLSKSDRGRRLG
jgi:hypothetical protein